jgi:hypothetical protein
MTWTPPGRMPAVSSVPGCPPVNQLNVGHQLSRYSIRGAVSRARSSNTALSPRVTRAADGTGMTQAARCELPRTPKDIRMSSVLPSHAISARSSTTDAPARSGMYAPQPQAQAGAAMLVARPASSNITMAQIDRYAPGIARPYRPPRAPVSTLYAARRRSATAASYSSVDHYCLDWLGTCECRAGRWVRG